MVSHGEVSSIQEISDPKLSRLVDVISPLGKVAVAYSGGVDSTFLLKACQDVLGGDALGVLAHSESLDRNEYRSALKVAESMGIPIRTIETREYENSEYRKNDSRRCYHCKSELFSKVVEFAAREGIPHVLDGSNLDDLSDFRPGKLARDEKGVRSPLQEAGLTKAEIRRHSRLLGMPTWDKPAAPCLSSRIPYGSEVTEKKLRQVEAAEASLRALGFRELRVRHHDEIARIEIPPEEFSRLLVDSTRQQVLFRMKEVGFLYVTLDIQGFRSGSLNEAIKLEKF